MVRNHKGDLLKSGYNIICHQVNLEGIMGGGIAKQIADKYPQCEQQYKEFCDKFPNKLALGGMVNFYRIDKNHYIANCFSQNADYTTNYIWLERCVERIKEFARDNRLATIGIPKNYGAGIANGDWGKVEKIFTNAFKLLQTIILQIWELERME